MNSGNTNVNPELTAESIGERDSDGLDFFEDVAEGYFIQELEERNKPKLNYYFDSFDVINLIQGGWAYDSGFKFDRAAIRRDRGKLSVYALAFDGFFETIRMLPPHQMEFETKLDQSDTFFKSPTREQYSNLVTEVLYAQELDSRNVPNNLNESNIDNYINELIKKGGHLYRANYLLREKVWANRLKYLINKKILGFVEYGQELDDIKNPKLLETIWNAFDKVRPDRSNNNFYDALALYYLQNLLENHLKDPRLPLPVFFASSSKVKEAINIVRQGYPQLFAYWNEKNEKWIPIVRDSLFFVLEAVFTVGDKTESFFKSLEKKQEEIKALVRGEFNSFRGDKDLIKNLEQSRKEFEEAITEIINVKFVQEIWLENKAYESLVIELKEVYNFHDKELPLITDSIKKELDKTLDQANLNLQNSIKISAIIEGFKDIIYQSKTIFDQKKGIKSDIFRDFALMKFGLDSRRLPGLQKILNVLVDFADDDDSRLPPAVYDLMTSLSYRPDNPEKARRFLLALTVAWILGKNHLIEKLGAEYEETSIAQRYDLALIYAAALIEAKKGRRDSIDRVKKIIRCVLSKESKNYKVWIGVGYLYFRLWISKTHLKPDLPEMHLQAWENQTKSKEYQLFFQDGALKYAKKSYKYLEANRLDDDINKENLRFQSYLYALNNVIYYTTKCSNSKEFEKLQPLVEELQNYESFTEWQGRSYDTLGWYYLRLYLLSTDKSLKKDYLKLAEGYYEATEKHFSSPRDFLTFKQLKLAIIRAKESKTAEEEE